jgi:CheY-like chemotaxis protein
VSDAKRPRILVVDDEDSVRRLLLRIVAELDADVVEAANGLEALVSISARRPDLVLLDLMMPELDGWGVLERLRERPDPPPVLLVTARTDYPTFARAVREGAVGFIGKPFRLQELLRACRTLLADRDQPMVGNERRGAARRRLLAEVRVSSEAATPIAMGEIVDISTTGAQLELDAPLAPGERIRLSFPTPGMPLPQLPCSVQWWSGTPSGRVSHGLAFGALGEDDRRLLEDLLRPAS